jgi:hypothetical protein
MLERGVKHWVKRELDLTRRKLQVQDSLATVEAAAGARLLDAEETEDGGGSDAALGDLGRAQAELRAIGVAIAGCRWRRLDAIRAKRAGEVAYLRKQISAKETELAKLDSETQQCIDKLNELQHTKLTVGIVMPNPEQGFCEIPYGGKLRTEIADLEGRAAQMESCEIPPNGMVDLNSEVGIEVDAVLSAALSHSSDGPSAQLVLDWFDGCKRMARSRHTPIEGHAINRCYLKWRAGVIIEAESYLFCRALATPVKGPTFGEVSGYNTAAGSFHSAPHSGDSFARQLATAEPEKA